jgi:hypothetical protein
VRGTIRASPMFQPLAIPYCTSPEHLGRHRHMSMVLINLKHTVAPPPVGTQCSAGAEKGGWT